MNFDTSTGRLVVLKLTYLPLAIASSSNHSYSDSGEISCCQNIIVQQEVLVNFLSFNAWLKERKIA